MANNYNPLPPPNNGDKLPCAKQTVGGATVLSATVTATGPVGAPAVIGQFLDNTYKNVIAISAQATWLPGITYHGQAVCSVRFDLPAATFDPSLPAPGPAAPPPYGWQLADTGGNGLFQSPVTGLTLVLSRGRFGGNGDGNPTITNPTAKQNVVSTTFQCQGTADDGSDVTGWVDDGDGNITYGLTTQGPTNWNIAFCDLDPGTYTLVVVSGSSSATLDPLYVLSGGGTM